MYKEDLKLNNLNELIYHKMKPTNQPPKSICNIRYKNECNHDMGNLSRLNSVFSIFFEALVSLKSMNQSVLLVVFLIGQVFHVTGHNALPFCFRSHPSPSWSETLDNLIFSPSCRSSQWLSPVALIPLENHPNSLVAHKHCDMSGPVEFLLSVICDHIRHSALLPDYRASNVQRNDHY